MIGPIRSPAFRKTSCSEKTYEAAANHIISAAWDEVGAFRAVLAPAKPGAIFDRDPAAGRHRQLHMGTRSTTRSGRAGPLRAGCAGRAVAAGHGPPASPAVVVERQMMQRQSRAAARSAAPPSSKVWTWKAESGGTIAARN